MNRGESPNGHKGYVTICVCMVQMGPDGNVWAPNWAQTMCHRDSNIFSCLPRWPLETWSSEPNTKPRLSHEPAFQAIIGMGTESIAELLKEGCLYPDTKKHGLKQS